MEHKLKVWTPAKVGCYWNCGDYHIATVSGDGRSYYRVALRFDEIGQTDTLDEAKELAQRDATVRTAAPDLLEALKKYQAFAENNYADSDLHDADGSSWIAQGRAAIAKAEGRER